MCDHCSCRTFGPIADLTREHEEILVLAWDVAERGDPDGQRATGLLALLELHGGKEELGLYPRLLESGDLDPEVLDRLEAEHVTIREQLLRGSFDRRSYYALAAHIEEEELELFPAAMFAFDDEVWDELEALAAPA